MPRDYYDVLSVPQDASQKDIKRAYRKLAMKYHPDRSDEPDAEERFKEISEAYAVLSDEDKRRVYDQYGHAGLEGQYGSADQWFQEADFNTVFRDLGFDIGGIFQQMFGGGFGGGQRRPRGEDLVTRITVGPEEVVHGAQREVTVERLEPCQGCDGTGAGPGGSRETCQQCGGRGQVGRTQRTPLGTFTQVTTCPRCEGQGTTITDPCKTCNGRALQRKTKRIDVHVPPGIEDGMRLRLRGQGHAHAQGPRGDAYAVVSVELPDHIERRGSNAVARITVPAAMAVLGTSTVLEGLDSELDIEIPAGTQPGQAIRKRGKGFPPVGGGSRGDMFIEVNVELPEKPSGEEREHWEALLELGGGEVRKGVLERLGDKVRDVLS